MTHFSPGYDGLANCDSYFRANREGALQCCPFYGGSVPDLPYHISF
jgi:hypothetical protein